MSESGKNDITYVEFPLVGNEDYVRIECIDCNGNTAWSNPIF